MFIQPGIISLQKDQFVLYVPMIESNSVFLHCVLVADSSCSPVYWLLIDHDSVLLMKALLVQGGRSFMFQTVLNYLWGFVSI